MGILCCLLCQRAVGCGKLGGRSDGYFAVSVNHTLDGFQAAETTTSSGMVYFLPASKEVALERFPKEAQQ